MQKNKPRNSKSHKVINVSANNEEMMQEENIFYTVDMQREVRDFVQNLEKESAEYPPVYERDPVEIRNDQEEGLGRYE